MMLDRILTILLIGLFAGGVFASEVFKWTDEDGTVHFSDRPEDVPDDAESVVLPKAQTFTAPAAPQTRRKTQKAQGEAAEAEEQKGYTELSILRPSAQEVLWGTGGEVEVEVSVNPTLQSGHSILLFVDDQMVDGQAGGGTTFKLTEVYRGTHSIHAEVRDSAGKRLIKSPATEFTVQQQSLFNQNNPNNNVTAPVRPIG